MFKFIRNLVNKYIQVEPEQEILNKYYKGGGLYGWVDANAKAIYEVNKHNKLWLFFNKKTIK